MIQSLLTWSNLFEFWCCWSTTHSSHPCPPELAPSPSPPTPTTLNWQTWRATYIWENARTSCKSNRSANYIRGLGMPQVWCQRLSFKSVCASTVGGIEVASNLERFRLLPGTTIRNSREKKMFSLKFSVVMFAAMQVLWRKDPRKAERQKIGSKKGKPRRSKTYVRR